MAGWLTAVVTPTKIVCTPTTEQCETVHFSTDIHPTATKRILAQSRGPPLAASVQTFPLAKRCAVKPTQWIEGLVPLRADGRAGRRRVSTVGPAIGDYSTMPDPIEVVLVRAERPFQYPGGGDIRLTIGRCVSTR